MKVIYIYKWATLGGVERVILNRTHALKDAKLGCKTCLYFMFDVGGGGKIKDYIKYNKLNHVLEIVEVFNPNDYDVIISIDTPEIFSKIQTHPNVILECHTAYTVNREYLKNLPSFVKHLVVPSEIFKNVLTKEYPAIAPKIEVLNNFVYKFSKENDFPQFFISKIPLLSIGRLDELKNPLEIIRMTGLMKAKLGDKFVLFLIGADYIGLDKIFSFAAENGLEGRVVYLPHVAFVKSYEFFLLIKQHKGVFVSASTGETFGMAAAEAMTYGLPVLLSGIEAHNKLCDNNHQLLYNTGNPEEAALKLENILEHWNDYSVVSTNLSRKFNSTVFLKQWKSLHLTPKKQV